MNSTLTLFASLAPLLLMLVFFGGLFYAAFRFVAAHVRIADALTRLAAAAERRNSD